MVSLGNLSHIESIAELADVAQKVRAKISFWGSRYVSFADPNYEGTLHIDDLAARVIQIAKDRGFEFTKEERVIGRNLAERITQLYSESDAELSKRNCLTFLFLKLRALASSLFGSGVFGGVTCPVIECGFYSQTFWTWTEIYETFNCKHAYKHLFDFYPEMQFRREILDSLRTTGALHYPKFENPEKGYSGPILYRQYTKFERGY